jgi:hypothetical protein
VEARLGEWRAGTLGGNIGNRQSEPVRLAASGGVACRLAVGGSATRSTATGALRTSETPQHRQALNPRTQRTRRRSGLIYRCRGQLVLATASAHLIPTVIRIRRPLITARRRDTVPSSAARSPQSSASVSLTLARTVNIKLADGLDTATPARALARARRAARRYRLGRRRNRLGAWRVGRSGL